MKISTFKDDLLGLEEFSHRLEKFISTEHEYVEGSLVIALTSKYGSGKTTFLEMWKSSLKNADKSAGKPLVISLNAWESDYYGDPLFAIISALVEGLEIDGEPTNSLVNAAKDFGWFSTALAGQVVKKISGIDPVAAGDLAEKKKNRREESTQNILDEFSIYQGRKTAMESLKGVISEFVAASEPKVLFLVDELDRCRPDYAISYLETIKHIFDIKGAVFLLAADRQQLENSAKTAFGENLDFEEYYRKFVHREITLPPVQDDGYKTLASKYVGYYLEREGVRHCFMKLERHRVDGISELIGELKLTPRQIQEVFRILGHIFSTSSESSGRLLWCLAVGSILMAALRVGDPRIFHLLGSRRLKAEEAVEYFKGLMGDDNCEWWFFLLLTGGGLLEENEESSEEILKRVGLLGKNEDYSVNRKLGEWTQGWGHSRSGRFSEVYKNIEQICQWK